MNKQEFSASSWRSNQGYTKMHGQPTIKICNAKQARQIYQYKKIKTTLYKNNAAIWYNKTCRIKQLTPSYINIRINGNTPRCQRTKNAAICYRINQELKFQYAKESFLNRCTRQSPAESDDTRGCTYTVMTWTSWWWAGLMLKTCRGV